MFVVIVGLLLAAAAAPATAWASPATSYRIVDLGSLGGGYGGAEAVNDRGEVVGYSTTARGEQHAFLWSRGQMTDLGTLGGAYSYAADINNHGQVVGYSYTASGEGHPFLWADGRMTDLGGLYCSAEAINDDGQVIGNCLGHPVLWSDGQMTDLTTQGLAPYATARDINDAGQIVGGHLTAGNAFHAYRYHDGQVLDLGALASDYSEAVAVNGHGQAAGRGANASGYMQAYYWSGRGIVAIGSFDGTYSEARGLNNRGQVVGSSSTGGSVHGFVWQRGVLFDLGVLAAGGWSYSWATDVNAHGLIVGGSYAADGQAHPVLWRPTNAKR